MPRPRQQPDASGSALLGAIVGGLMARSGAGVLAGGTLGAFAGGSGKPVAVPLAAALAGHVKSLGGTFVSFHRVGSHGGRLSLRFGDDYRLLDIAAEPNMTHRDDIDDALYDDAVAKLAAP